MVKIFIVNGLPGAGKDEFCSLVHYYARTKTQGTSSKWMCDIISTINPYKNVLYKLGWDGQKTPEIRKLLSDMKFILPIATMDYIRTEVNELTMRYPNCIIFIMAREPKNIEEIKNMFNGDDRISTHTVFIDAKDRINPIISNEADAGVYDYEYDLIIDNNFDLYFLQVQAQNFVERECV